MDFNFYDKPVAVDTVYSETTFIDDSYTCDQLFFVTNSLVSVLYGITMINVL